jgi:hypothetical protein
MDLPASQALNPGIQPGTWHAGQPQPPAQAHCSIPPNGLKRENEQRREDQDPDLLLPLTEDERLGLLEGEWWGQQRVLATSEWPILTLRATSRPPRGPSGYSIASPGPPATHFTCNQPRVGNSPYHSARQQWYGVHWLHKFREMSGISPTHMPRHATTTQTEQAEDMAHSMHALNRSHDQLHHHQGTLDPVAGG